MTGLLKDRLGDLAQEVHIVDMYSRVRATDGEPFGGEGTHRDGKGTVVDLDGVEYEVTVVCTRLRPAAGGLMQVSSA